MVRLGSGIHPHAGTNVTNDAIVVIPGIMGSRLVEATSGRILWGIGRIVQYILRWRQGEGLKALAVTEDERAGRVGRVRPDGLLRTPEWAPSLGGLEPYTRLVQRLRSVVVHPDAVLEFAYDWRLSVEFNAGLLATAAARHLEMWREHPARLQACRARGDEAPPRLVLVAHSMGGLLAAAMCARFPEVAAEVRDTVTLGTPFAGSVKAAMMLNAGRGAPVPLSRELLRDAARTMPGVHDLLPSYRCLVVDDDVVAPTARDAESWGADSELAEQAMRLHERLGPSVLPGHRAVAGYGQRTDQSLRLRDGVLQALPYGFRRRPNGELVRDETGRAVPIDHTGDGTVFRYSAAPPGTRDITLVQQHGALARTDAAIDIVCGAVTRAEPGAVLGEPPMDLRVPDEAAAGEPFEILVGRVAEAGRVSCVIEDALRADRIVARPLLKRTGGGSQDLAARVTMHEVGLFRVKVSAGGDPVTQLVLVQG